MEKKIYIYAYTQMNLGDDLFIKILCERYSEVKFYILANTRTSKALKDITNLVVIPSVPYIDGILRKMKIDLSVNNIIQRILSARCDGIVNIGGSIFIESERFLYDSKQFKKRILKDKPYYIIGSNFGPYKDNHFYDKYRSIFKDVEDICFRDKYSYGLFSDLENIRYAQDVVFSYSPNSVEVINKQIMISVIDLESRKDLKGYKSLYQEKIIELSRYFYEKGYCVVLMGFCEREGDNKAIKEILEMLTCDERESIKSYFYSGDLEEGLKVIGESRYVIATRFHAMILGWIFNRNVYSLIYSNKSLNVINDIGFNGGYSKIQDIVKLKADEVFESLTSIESLDITKQVISANLQFEKFDEFICKL